MMMLLMMMMMMMMMMMIGVSDQSPPKCKHAFCFGEQSDPYNWMFLETTSDPFHKANDVRVLGKEVMFVGIWVDGSEIRLTSWYVKFPVIYRVLYIPGGCLGFLPSTVWVDSSWKIKGWSPTMEVCEDDLSFPMLIFQGLLLVSSDIRISHSFKCCFHPTRSLLMRIGIRLRPLPSKQNKIASLYATPLDV